MLVVQNRLNPSTVLDEIAAAVPIDADQMFLAVAYVTQSGLDLLLDRVVRQVGRTAFTGMRKRMITTCDYGLTDPAALQHWLGLGGEARMANGGNIARGRLEPTIAYHPKVYGFRAQAGDWLVASGSANLTARGMTVNSEAMLTSLVPRGQMRPLKRLLSEGALPVTPALLADYAQLRAAQPPAPSLAIQVAGVRQPPNPPANLDVFGNAVASGAADPIQSSRLWVQTLAISGGSLSQVELPRGANIFFGFNYTAHVPGYAVVIGQPVLASGRGRWLDRNLSWHGDNRMERMNMPTQAMGGYAYAQSAVCFRRRANEFEFTVAPWNSSLARSWRAASTAAGQVYKLGTNSPRLCGLL